MSRIEKTQPNHLNSSSGGKKIFRANLYSEDYYVWDYNQQVWKPYSESITSLTGSFYGDGSGLTGITSTPTGSLSSLSAVVVADIPERNALPNNLPGATMVYVGVDQSAASGRPIFVWPDDAVDDNDWKLAYYIPTASPWDTAHALSSDVKNDRFEAFHKLHGTANYVTMKNRSISIKEMPSFNYPLTARSGDITQALQDAIDYAKLSGTMRVEIPTGEWVLSATVSAEEAMHLVGTGHEWGTRLRASTTPVTDFSLLSTNNKRMMRIENIMFMKLSRSAAGMDVSAPAVVKTSTSDFIEFYNCFFEYTGGALLLEAGNGEVKIDNCYFIYNDNYAISAECNQVKITNTIFENWNTQNPAHSGNGPGSFLYIGRPWRDRDYSVTSNAARTNNSINVQGCRFERSRIEVVGCGSSIIDSHANTTTVVFTDESAFNRYKSNTHADVAVVNHGYKNEIEGISDSTTNNPILSKDYDEVRSNVVADFVSGHAITGFIGDEFLITVNNWAEQHSSSRSTVYSTANLNYIPIPWRILYMSGKQKSDESTTAVFWGDNVYGNKKVYSHRSLVRSGIDGTCSAYMSATGVVDSTGTPLSEFTRHARNYTVKRNLLNNGAFHSITDGSTGGWNYYNLPSSAYLTGDSVIVSLTGDFLALSSSRYGIYQTIDTIPGRVYGIHGKFFGSTGNSGVITIGNPNSWGYYEGGVSTIQPSWTEDYSYFYGMFTAHDYSENIFIGAAGSGWTEIGWVAVVDLTDDKVYSRYAPSDDFGYNGMVVYNTTTSADPHAWKNVNGTWVELGSSSGLGGTDNLGDHTATQAINLDDNYISNDGSNNGLRIDDTHNIHSTSALEVGDMLSVGGAGLTASRSDTEIFGINGIWHQHRNSHTATGYVSVGAYGQLQDTTTSGTTDTSLRNFNIAMNAYAGYISTTGENWSSFSGINPKLIRLSPDAIRFFHKSLAGAATWTFNDWDKLMTVWATGARDHILEVDGSVSASDYMMNFGYTNAEDRGIEAKLKKEYVSILDFGAVDGGESATAIQAAIDAAVGTYGKVYIPEGNYKVSRTIRIPNDITIFGDGHNTSKISVDPNFYTNTGYAFDSGSLTDSDNILAASGWGGDLPCVFAAVGGTATYPIANHVIIKDIGINSYEQQSTYDSAVAAVSNGVPYNVSGASEVYQNAVGIFGKFLESKIDNVDLLAFKYGGIIGCNNTTIKGNSRYYWNKRGYTLFGAGGSLSDVSGVQNEVNIHVLSGSEGITINKTHNETGMFALWVDQDCKNIIYDANHCTNYIGGTPYSIHPNAEVIYRGFPNAVKNASIFPQSPMMRTDVYPRQISNNATFQHVFGGEFWKADYLDDTWAVTGGGGSISLKKTDDADDSTFNYAFDGRGKLYAEVTDNTTFAITGRSEWIGNLDIEYIGADSQQLTIKVFDNNDVVVYDHTVSGNNNSDATIAYPPVKIVGSIESKSVSAAGNYSRPFRVQLSVDTNDNFMLSKCAMYRSVTPYGVNSYNGLGISADATDVIHGLDAYVITGAAASYSRFTTGWKLPADISYNTVCSFWAKSTTDEWSQLKMSSNAQPTDFQEDSVWVSPDEWRYYEIQVPQAYYTYIKKQNDSNIYIAGMAFNLIQQEKNGFISDVSYPTSYAKGWHNNGDIIMNNSPTGTEGIGWYCYNSGAPGSWREISAGGHDHDDEYLALTGGTVNGDVVITVGMTANSVNSSSVSASNAVYGNIIYTNDISGQVSGDISISPVGGNVTMNTSVIGSLTSYNASITGQVDGENGMTIERRTDDSVTEVGRIWLRTDL